MTEPKVALLEPEETIAETEGGQTYRNIDYSKTVIYKLRCKDPSITDFYIGATTNFRMRKCRHKYNTNTETAKEHTFKVYQFIRDNGGWENWEMEIIEHFPCGSFEESRVKEAQMMNEFKSTLNTHISSVCDPAQRRQYNIEYCRNHYKQNREQILEDMRIHYQQNCDAIKARRKIYYDEVLKPRLAQKKLTAKKQ